MKKIQLPDVFVASRGNVAAVANDMRKNLLASLEDVSGRDELLVFQKYITVFHPHFIPWVSAMQNSCRSLIGQYAAKDNLALEVVENHQKMLWDFMQQFKVGHDPLMYKLLLSDYITPVNEVMIEGVKMGHGIGTSAVIFLLEETSQTFIPWMGSVAKRRLEEVNMEYINKHGEADAAHATLALDAYEGEYLFGSGQSGPYDVYAKYAIERVDKLLRAIFHPSLYDVK